MSSDEVVAAESRLIEQWIRPAVGAEAALRVGDVAEAPLSDGVEVTLTMLELAPAPAARRGNTPVPMQLRARYLVSVRGSPSARHQALADLAFAAGVLPGIELDPMAPGPALWRSLGTTARPALVVSVLLTRERKLRAAPRVRQPLETRWRSSTPLAGRVLGPGDVPIAGALVEVEGAPLAAYSDHRGEFRFRAVPGGDASPTLVVSAKGERLTVRVQESHGPDDPVLIRVPISES